ncbi:hypothetical protein RF679_16230 [Undibacterium cyanobacteriorum]|uniref:Uncharacterized protein n=1 Tax=Undibacterium cyanobacteriorum TaxID=3073561 RepID=A0ABY9RG21_9BURK|nr:hypothetical protein [Undibacterium sp. 20NA77.5]WMW80181.1 hypothetical protein RF679_16230 [Undibacterium sp. 20NA77.5]
MNHWKTLLVASVIAIAVNASFAESVTTPMPQAWIPGAGLGKQFATKFEQEEKLSSITAAFGQVNTGKDKDQIFTISARPSASVNDAGVLTRVIDVRQWQNRSFNLAFFFKQEGEIANKDVWVRFFDERGQISLTQVNLPLSYDDRNAKEHWLNAIQLLRIPAQAQRMEIGIGMRGQGQFKIRNLTIRPIPVNYGEQEKASLAYAAPTMRHIENVKIESITLEP